MHICYLDESGTPEVPGTSSHFVLTGLSVPIEFWRTADDAIGGVLVKYGLQDAELHTAWLLRPYIEQRQITDFSNLAWDDRRREVGRKRIAELLRLQKIGGKVYNRTRKQFKHTNPYIHLTHDERQQVARDVADTIAGWSTSFLFAECIDKLHFDPVQTKTSIVEQAFEQVISRFQRYLGGMASVVDKSQNFGLLVHDNNETVAKKHTALMRKFHSSGTNYTRISNIIETPLFVDSSLTRMVQMADLCSYALRRFVENGETDLFQRVLKRAHVVNDRAVGVRHFAGLSCQCRICEAHHRGRWVT
jgi:hypothetical protein